MDTLYYIWEVICQAWPIILIMGMVAIPIMWVFHNESLEEWEKLDKYYDPSSDNEKENLKD